MAVSSLWETAPIGDIPQGAYLNAVVILDTVLGPRPCSTPAWRSNTVPAGERRERWGPRTLDLDLLLYGDAAIDAPGLRVPHPRMAERRFVLAPLAEVWPDAIVPGAGPVTTLLAAVKDQDAVRIDEPGWPPS